MLYSLQKIGVAIMRAIEEKDDLKSILPSCADEMQKMAGKNGMPLNNLATPEAPAEPSQEQPAQPPQGQEEPKQTPPAAPQVPPSQGGGQPPQQQMMNALQQQPPVQPGQGPPITPAPNIV